MPSKSSDTRENQLRLFDQRIQERRANLEKRGIPPKDISRDKVYEHLMAKRRAIMKSIVAIGVSKARNMPRMEAAAEQAAPAPAAPKEKKAKKEKTAPAKAGH
jgi:hypothetical protein